MYTVALKPDVARPPDESAPEVEFVLTPSWMLPDGGYGWVCVGAQFLINGFTWGVAAVNISKLKRLFVLLMRSHQELQCLPSILPLS